MPQPERIFGRTVSISPLDEFFALQDEITIECYWCASSRFFASRNQARRNASGPATSMPHDLVAARHPLAHSVMLDGASACSHSFNKRLQESLTMQPPTVTRRGVYGFGLVTRRLPRGASPRCDSGDAHKALVYGRHDAYRASALGGFVIGFLEHDHATAPDAFEAVLSLQPLIPRIFVPPRERHRCSGGRTQERAVRTGASARRH